MALLILASAAFLVTHLGVSSTPLRGVLVNSLGQNGYLGVYSLMAFATLGLMIYAYIEVPHGNFVWAPGLVETAIARALMPLAFIFALSGVMVKNPTGVGQDAPGEEPLAGIFKITRHPVQWGILLWAVSHVIANPDQASIVFFGTFALLSAVGMAAMDARRQGSEASGWEHFYATTSYVPFAAMLGGRTSLALRELNWLPIVLGVVVFVVVYVFHDWVSGVALM